MHTPQSSSIASPFTVPAQSVHDELSPAHTPQSSIIASPFTVPAQSVQEAFQYGFIGLLGSTHISVGPSQATPVITCAT